MSAPVGQPIWVNPCGGVTPPSGPHLDMEMSSPPVVDLLNNILINAKTTLQEAKSFREEYVLKTFNQNFKNHHDTWLMGRMPWLPNKDDIPKDLSEKTPLAHFRKHDLDLHLLKSYEFLQRYAIGLEQVNQDMKREREEFSDKFYGLMYMLRQVLCEVQTALLERNSATQIIDMERSIMDETEREGKDKTSRHFRDWIIYRDLMNSLEYLIDLCQFFKDEDAKGAK